MFLCFIYTVMSQLIFKSTLKVRRISDLIDSLGKLALDKLCFIINAGDLTAVPAIFAT